MHLSVIIFSFLLCSVCALELESDQLLVEESVLPVTEILDVAEDEDEEYQHTTTTKTTNLLQPVKPVRGCKDLGACCQGRNSSCYVSNRYEDGKKWKNCYCDSECSVTGDCCTDYKETCPAVDCETSKWQEWSQCSKLCGDGVRNRTRSIVTASVNGGERCPHLVEVAKCIGDDCNIKRDTRRNAKRETGRILPIRFASYRTSSQYDIRKGIRKNLYDYYHSENSILSKPTYCATYAITYARPHCRRQRYGDWAKELMRGTRMCVECQSNAMHPALNGRCKGDGVLKRDTRWKAVGVSACSGWWKLVTKPKECNCNAQLKDSYIFV